MSEPIDKCAVVIGLNSALFGLRRDFRVKDGMLLSSFLFPEHGLALLVSHRLRVSELTGCQIGRFRISYHKNILWLAFNHWFIRLLSGRAKTHIKFLIALSSRFQTTAFDPWAVRKLGKWCLLVDNFAIFQPFWYEILEFWNSLLNHFTLPTLTLVHGALAIGSCMLRDRLGLAKLDLSFNRVVVELVHHQASFL